MIVIHNPVAGARRTQRLWRVLDTLTANGIRVRLLQTTHAGHAQALAAEAARPGHLIVAAGGDGTIAEVAAGIAASGALLGVIPLGTANVLARELDLPTRPRAIAAALAFRRTTPLWPGLARTPERERLFVQMLGVGLDAVVVHRLPAPLKRCLGPGAYVAQTLREMLRYPYRPIRVRLDGQEMEAGSIVVTKGRLYAGPYRLAPDAAPGAPGFTVALFGRTGPGAVLMYGTALVLNQLPHAPGMRLLRAHEIDILDPPVAAQADGDPAGMAPVAIRDAAAPIAVVTG